MATSGSTDFTITRDNIIRDAMLEINALDAEEDPTSTELTDASRMLNMMLKSWAKFTKIYATEDIDVTLTPGTESYTIGTGLTIDTDRPLAILSGRREDSSGIEVPIEIYSREEYMELPVKSTQAPANGVYYDPQLTAKLYVWPTGQTGNTTLHLTTKRVLEDFDAATDNPDLPQEWYLAIVKNLAKLIHRQFTGRAPDQDLVQEASFLLSSCTMHDSENTSIMVQPR